MKMRDSFIVKLSVELGWTALASGIGIPWAARGPVAYVITGIMDFVIGDMADRGIIVIDLGEDAIKIALARKEYRAAALRAYRNASARVYTEAEKKVIRDQFRDIIKKYGPVAGAHPKSSVSNSDDSER